MILALKKLEEEYLDLNQTIIILDILDNFEIRNKLSYIIINNATSNNNLINVITITLYKKRVFYNTYQRRLKCNNHVINLAI